jgi:hypothetical protein
VRSDLLVPSGHRSYCPTRGEATHWSVMVGEREASHDAWSYQSPPPGWDGVRGYVAFTWNAMDAWLEEDEEVFVHPRDPHHRVEVDGVVEEPPATKWTTGIPARDLI